MSTHATESREAHAVHAAIHELPAPVRTSPLDILRGGARTDKYVQPTLPVLLGAYGGQFYRQ